MDQLSARSILWNESTDCLQIRKGHGFLGGEMLFGDDMYMNGMKHSVIKRCREKRGVVVKLSDAVVLSFEG